jgi:hypothetical protein
MRLKHTALAIAFIVLFSSAGIPQTATTNQDRSCLSSGGKVQRVIIRRGDVVYAAVFTSFMS